ncbi:MAG: hypothetical protein ABIB12_03210 [Patescibacteria group bacterium]
MARAVEERVRAVKEVEGVTVANRKGPRRVHLLIGGITIAVLILALLIIGQGQIRNGDTIRTVTGERTQVGESIAPKGLSLGLERFSQASLFPSSIGELHASYLFFAAQGKTEELLTLSLDSSIFRGSEKWASLDEALNRPEPWVEIKRVDAVPVVGPDTYQTNVWLDSAWGPWELHYQVRRFGGDWLFVGAQKY